MSDRLTIGAQSGQVMTVLGPVHGSKMGVTLPHEHILLDATRKWVPPADPDAREWAMRPLAMDMLGDIAMNPLGNRDNCLLDDPELSCAELTAFVNAGGQTVIDPTNIGIGRNPQALADIARRTGLNIVMGAGYYLQPSHPTFIETETVEALAARIVYDVGGSAEQPSIKAGLIGEIGVSSIMAAQERKVLVAAAQASAETSVPMQVHLPAWKRLGHDILDIVAREGVDLQHVMLCHMNPSHADVLYQHELAERGAFLEYDMIGMSYYYPEEDAQSPSDAQSAEAIAELISAGFGHKVLLSHDVFLKSMLTRYGGNGYAFILRHFVPRLRRLGLDERAITALLVDNPRAAMTNDVNLPL